MDLGLVVLGMDVGLHVVLLRRRPCRAVARRWSPAVPVVRRSRRSALDRLDPDALLGLGRVLEVHLAGDRREHGVVVAEPGARAGQEGHPALADDDRAGRDELAVAGLDAESLADAVAAVLELPPAFLCAIGLLVLLRGARLLRRAALACVGAACGRGLRPRRRLGAAGLRARRLGLGASRLRSARPSALVAVAPSASALASSCGLGLRGVLRRRRASRRARRPRGLAARRPPRGARARSWRRPRPSGPPRRRSCR